MKSPAEFWQLLIYCSDSARGSPTGVVFPGDLFANEYQATAAALGYPDTVFLTPGVRDGEWNARSFSPSQELSLCTQALIAAFRVLQKKLGSPAAQFLFHTPSGPIEVSELVPERKDIAWLVGPYRILARNVSRFPIPHHDGAGTGEVLVDTGRTRLFGELPSVDRLSAVNLTPSEVMAYCAAERIDGICLFARSGDRELRMRVFTTSLDGREDISTGGAVMGLLPHLKTAGKGASGWWTVHQGFGLPHQRGTLFTTLLERPGMAAVGGGHRFVAKGTLL